MLTIFLVMHFRNDEGRVVMRLSCRLDVKMNQVYRKLRCV